MLRLQLKKHRMFISAVLAVLTAAVIRQIGFLVNEQLGLCCSILRTLIYIGIIATWGISVGNRIMQPQVRRYLVTISLLMGFWFTARGIRYCLNDNYWLMRHLWYLYYLPMLFIPLLALFMAAALGKPDNQRLPDWMKVLYLPTTVPLLFVLTNDLHQLVFRFPEDALVWKDDYRYGPVYYLTIGWIILCVLTALVMMLYKCRVPHNRKVLILPFVPVAVVLIYGLLLVFRALGVFRLAWLSLLAADMTAVFCLLIIAIVESCIRCGLIQANTGYEELFMAGRIGAQIVNGENKVCLASSNALSLTEAQRLDAQTHPVSPDKNMLVVSHPIRFGHVLWQEDVTELSEAIEQIEENCSELAESNRIRRENLEMRKRILALQERNRATDLLHRETAGQIEHIDALLAQYEKETDERERRKLLAGAAVLGAYIKRYGNLLLVSGREQTTDIRDLARCFEDSFLNLELLDITCLCTFPSDVPLATKDMLRVFRFFETVLEACLDDLHAVWVNARESGTEIILIMEFICDTDLSGRAAAADTFSCEDGTCRFGFRLQKGGEDR